MVQNAISSQPDTSTDIPEQQQNAHLNETTFLNWQDEEFCGVNDDPAIARFTRAKKRALEADQVAGKDKELATAGSSLTKNPHKEADLTAAKVHQKMHSAMPYSIVDSMKRMNVSMTMWDSLSIPRQAEI